MVNDDMNDINSMILENNQIDYVLDMTSQLYVHNRICDLEKVRVTLQTKQQRLLIQYYKFSNSSKPEKIFF